MWRFAVLPSILVLLATPASAQMAMGGFLKDIGMGQQAEISIKDTMNFEDCANSKWNGLCDKPVVRCGGELHAVFAYDYREPVVLVEVSCRPGQSALMKQTPMGAVLGSAFGSAMKAAVGAGKCLEQQASGTTGNQGQESTSGWHFEARAFAISPLDRAIAARASGSKAKAAMWNLVCDSFLTFKNYSLFNMDMDQLTGMQETLGQLPTSLTDIMGNMATMTEGFSSLGFGDILEEGGGGLLESATSGITDSIDAATGGAAGTVKEGMAMLDTLGCSPMTVAMVKLSNKWPAGLLPLFVSDVTRPCWTVGNPASLANPINAIKTSANVTSGAALSSLCTLNSMGSSLGLGNVQTVLSDATVGLADPGCLGNWGQKKPESGYASNMIRPLSAALVGWRAYDLASKTENNKNKNLRNRKGKVMFNMDYPFINGNDVAVPVAKELFTAMGAVIGGKRHGHKGSGCYEPGSANPSWFTQGETMIANPLTVAQNMTADFLAEINKSAIKSNNGDYVFTYWKNTRCCIPWGCVRKTYKEY
jgi:hypothetical protein